MSKNVAIGSAGNDALFSVAFENITHHPRHLRVNPKAKEIVDTFIQCLVDRLFAWTVGGREAEAVNPNPSIAKCCMRKIPVHISIQFPSLTVFEEVRTPSDLPEPQKSRSDAWEWTSIFSAADPSLPGKQVESHVFHRNESPKPHLPKCQSRWADWSVCEVLRVIFPQCPDFVSPCGHRRV